MDGDKKPIVRKPLVLRKLNADNLHIIERGLLGDLPNKLKPQPLGPTRDQCTDLEVSKSPGILSACLFPESPVSERVSSSDEEGPSSLKKSFSFRDRLSRISFFGKEKKHAQETDLKMDLKDIHESKSEVVLDSKESNKSHKRSWFFKTKEFTKRKEHIPIYKRSKSFEFLPRAIEEEDEELSPGLKKNLSFGGSSDTMGDAWSFNESLEYIANVYNDSNKGVHLKSFKELECDDSHKSSQVSTGSTWTSGSSSNGNAASLLKTESVDNVFEEFHKAVELFSENYLSDCEPYTKSQQLTIKQKRKSSSFTNLPSPKVVNAIKVSEISEDFKKELAKALTVKRDVKRDHLACRRGSGTDWFVLEDQKIEENRYKRGQKKAVNRVRRMSSTKYVSHFYFFN
ncbi:unnamed protein product [Arctia plantaginis]|uniref:Uncharacterized protein n=1 Tax=Arctia plantaginis TaxID=874455 RepID=A0A8S0YM65_ARCPL|nr:unnamed protein product [Arctia plantaginis]